MNIIQFGKKKHGMDYIERPGSYAVIINDKKEIGIVEHRGRFFLPGGGIEQDENETETLLREVREETGFEVRVERFLGTSNEYVSNHDNSLTCNQIGSFFQCRIIEDHHDQSDISHKFIWIHHDTASSKLLRKSHIWAANVAFNELDKFEIQEGQGSKKGIYRLIRDNELDALLLLYDDLHEHDKKPGDRNEYKETWNEITENPQILYFVAELEGVLIASCHIVIIPNLTRACSPYGTIENVVCKKEYRNRGIGRGVLKYALNVAWTLGCYKVMLMTGSKNEWVFKFYENAGFERNIKTAFYAKP